MRRLPPTVALAMTLALLALGCGAGEPGDGPRVAHPRFDGGFEITEVTVAGTDQGLDGAPGLEIDGQFGGLTVRPGCNTYLGSFSLEEDGRASFTVTGGSRRDCQGLSAQEAAILTALGQVEAWSTIDGGFRFDGPSTVVAVVGPLG